MTKTDLLGVLCLHRSKSFLFQTPLQIPTTSIPAVERRQDKRKPFLLHDGTNASTFQVQLSAHSNPNKSFHFDSHFQTMEPPREGPGGITVCTAAHQTLPLSQFFAQFHPTESASRAMAVENPLQHTLVASSRAGFYLGENRFFLSILPFSVFSDSKCTDAAMLKGTPINPEETIEYEM